MGCVQQAVLEFDEEVRAPWRPRLVSDTTAAGPATVRQPVRHAPSRVGVCAPGRGAERARREAGGTRGRVPRPVLSNPSAGGPARGRVGTPAPGSRARLRRTRRARRLAFVLAVAFGVALGSWLGPLLGGGAELRLAGDSSVVIQQGDSLWSIATSIAGAGDDVRAVVDEIQRLNNLSGTDLEPGQVLLLP